MEIIIIGLLAFAGYRFFRHTSRTGKEAVRAYVYLETLKKGLPPEDANVMTEVLLSDVGKDLAINAMNMAKLEYATVHRGKQLPMIGYAYRQGMQTTMPFWYQKMALAAPETLGIEVAYGRISTITTDEDPQADEDMRKDERYVDFYETYANEVHRISGKSVSDPRVTDLMEHEPLHRAHTDGIDPLLLAAKYCHDHKIIEKFADYESYYAAFAQELRRFSANASEHAGWLARAHPNLIDSNFKQDIHPRLTALSFHHLVTEQHSA
ncbi:hypothetical protein [Allorhizobium terrae]|uniref:Uncharacterized protein n=1 Tax=Allorhizobium terrae TaxID=1848972 RepID=A0A4S3ZXM8_9HYPH|nr:hypothetical protein [Allorhizobium terrae]THF50652.1 hypothetical protein E6C51_07260 [Allorhizobium terrae]